ncbi:4-(cytidine 5'-diphospho)-2-C-methyl-D-erythritol kinase [Ruegeria sp. PrR005]|uniref:4-diphosphocytidyl-2-C-methyl-D-erythritol kinase n=1 Tax=Ruegeria sp. PrR005 TaxID=2706882 RepID=A0A6B2NMD4_9RHOB|nr:4-(cytidine 5'-diphospho)-2-C-methyl-D-erythritol kinase [Ruegeria sp. PrR005]NDW45236.1 4-(cytidine 5'-diphospho)-2-C-methyl-D-erythritol kinase [Ruegeria sp. PrR005]
MAIEAFAPAKINLTLHVTGQRDDGYHLLDSLVVFASVGDRIRVAPSDALSLEIDGPEAGGLSAEPDNLVLRAARLLAPGRGAAITLTKRLPVASGIGGGSADAAATLGALSQLWDLPMPGAEQVLTLGADVPVCLSTSPARMRGIGERLDPVPQLPEMDIVLVNPRVAVSTPAVFRMLTVKENPPMEPDLPHWRDLPAFISWLGGQRNDLAAPAIAQQPVIADVLDALRDAGALFAGMSGSGATCFGLFPPDGHSAKSVAKAVLFLEHPEWWCTHGRVL